MNHPEQLDKAGRKIPLNATCRKWMGNALYDRLARIRRDAGVGPDQYPPVENDIQYDITKAQMGAEMAARETADLILPAILTGIAPRWRHRIAAALRHPLLAALLVIAAIIVASNHILLEIKADTANQQGITLAATQARADQLHNLAEAQRSKLESLQQQIAAADLQSAANEIRRSFHETIGRAILLRYQTRLNPERITVTVPESQMHRSGSRVMVDFDHGLTPEQFSALLDQIKSTKNATLGK